MSRSHGILGAGRILHGGDYNPDQWLRTPEIIDDDFRLIPLSGCNTFSVGIFAWTSYEAEEGVYTFDWLDSIMDRMAEQGNHVILATPSGAKPAWMAAKYPEVRRINTAGHREFIGNRHNHCWTSPIYREKVCAINTALAERYKDHPALGMWHLSNEYSGACYCEYCLAAFRSWLQKRYGTLDCLNDVWWTAFWSHTITAWEQIDPRDWSVDGMALDWRRFNSWQIADFIQFEAIPLRAITPGVPVTTNFMGANNDMDYSTISDVVDVITDDQYPRYYPEDSEFTRGGLSIAFKDDLYRCFKPDRPWMLMESCPDAPQWSKPKRLKRPGVHKTEMLQAIGHGAEGTCYFQWRSGRGSCEKFHGVVVDHSNSSETRVFKTVASLSALYEKLAPVIGTKIEAEVALIYDWDSKWGFDLSDGAPSKGYRYDMTGQDHYRPFWAAGIPVDVFRSERDFSAYKLVIAPILWMLKPGVAERIRAYVEAGGTFVTTFCSGICDEFNRVLMGGHPGDGLRQLLGVWNEETDVLDDEKTIALEAVPGNELAIGDLTGKSVRALLHLEGATTLANYGSEFYAGTPAITSHRVGKGRAIYIATDLDEDGYKQVYESIANDLGLKPVVDAVLPRGVAVQRRGAYLFIENFTSEAVSVTLPGSYTIVETGAALDGALELAPGCSEVLLEG